MYDNKYNNDFEYILNVNDTLLKEILSIDSVLLKSSNKDSSSSEKFNGIENITLFATVVDTRKYLVLLDLSETGSTTKLLTIILSYFLLDTFAKKIRYSKKESLAFITLASSIISLLLII